MNDSLIDSLNEKYIYDLFFVINNGKEIYLFYKENPVIHCFGYMGEIALVLKVKQILRISLEIYIILHLLLNHLAFL